MSSDRPPQSLDPRKHIQDLHTAIEQKKARIETLRAELSAEELDVRTMSEQLSDALTQRLRSAPAYVGIVNSLAPSTTIHGVHPEMETVEKLQLWVENGSRIHVRHILYSEVTYKILAPHSSAFEVTDDGNGQSCTYYLYPFLTLTEAEAWLKEMNEKQKKQEAAATSVPTPA